MSPRPFLYFNSPEIIRRTKLGSGKPKIHLPDDSRQAQRLQGQFSELNTAFQARRMELQQTPTGAIPEQVLVLETIGSVQHFFGAVRRIRGMEWFGEVDTGEIEPDIDFYRESNRQHLPVSGRAYLLMTNQDAMAQLLALWNRYKVDAGVSFEHGLKSWKNVFKSLKTIRPWDVEERLRTTGILELWEEQLREGRRHFRTEIELWYRKDEGLRRLAGNTIVGLVGKAGGRIVAQSAISEIGYHGILAELPEEVVREVLTRPDVELVRCDQVMYFRGTGQCSVTQNIEPSVRQQAPHHGLPSGQPVVALFDGLPIENHSFLAGRLRVDDPDNFAARCPAANRIHGTGMASAIVHGDIGSGPPLDRPIYCRPILVPEPGGFGQATVERIPEDVLPVDLIYRSVERLFIAQGGNAAVAPEVRIVNLSVCDSGRPFGRSLSAWARLIDWLAWRRNLVFIVSVGNHAIDIPLELPRDSISSTPGRILELEVLRSLASQGNVRRILAPAESINAISVGASHEDGAAQTWAASRFSPTATSGLLSGLNSLGFGYRRSIKPEILMPGGRQLYSEDPIGRDGKAVLTQSTSSAPPGILTAAPGGTAGVLDATRYSCGTSNAAALATRLGARIYEVLHRSFSDQGSEELFTRYSAVLTKTLLIHGARWSHAASVVKEALGDGSGRSVEPDEVSRLIGYGRVQEERCLGASDHRVTLIGFSSIKDGEGHLFRFPLPAALSVTSISRYLTVSLAWISPLDAFQHNYRKAALWFELPRDPLALTRLNYDWQSVRRGTSQHEIWSGSRARAFGDGAELQIKVNCRKDTGSLDETVSYGLAVTLELEEAVGINIFDEIRARIRTPVRV